MKKITAFAVAIVTAGVLFSDTATAAFDINATTYAVGDAASGIGQSRHNLGSLNPGDRNIKTIATSEICVFCHTPHHTNTANNLKPLWNRGTSIPASFTAYGATIGGTTIANTNIGSTSLACLSCHDGVTTFDNLVNAPGKSGLTVGGSDMGWTFVENDTVVSDFFSTNTPFDKSRYIIGMSLSNDHPVSVTYYADRAGLRDISTVIASINLTSDLAGSASSYDNGNLMKNFWAVKGFISDTATIADLLKDGRVECSSCHDPHFSNKSWQEVDDTYITPGLGLDSDPNFSTNGMFLRRVGGNSGSGVCRTCHNK